MIPFIKDEIDNPTLIEDLNENFYIRLPFHYFNQEACKEVSFVILFLFAIFPICTIVFCSSVLMLKLYFVAFRSSFRLYNRFSLKFANFISGTIQLTHRQSHNMFECWLTTLTSIRYKKTSWFEPRQRNVHKDCKCEF